MPVPKYKRNPLLSWKPTIPALDVRGYRCMLFLYFTVSRKEILFEIGMFVIH